MHRRDQASVLVLDFDCSSTVFGFPGCVTKRQGGPFKVSGREHDVSIGRGQQSGLILPLDERFSLYPSENEKDDRIVDGSVSL